MRSNAQNVLKHLSFTVDNQLSVPGNLRVLGIRFWNSASDCGNDTFIITNVTVVVKVGGISNTTKYKCMAMFNYSNGVFYNYGADGKIAAGSDNICDTSA
jgi:hypothetical protein